VVRVSVAGFIDVKSTSPEGVDVSPPSRITNLNVVKVSPANCTITLTWTAVGDDYISGGPGLIYLPTTELIYYKTNKK
jgi:calcium-activated chloride channel regulator 4